MTCKRVGCDERYGLFQSETYGSLCRSCLDELVATAGVMSIPEFMHSEKKTVAYDRNWDYYVTSVFT